MDDIEILVQIHELRDQCKSLIVCLRAKDLFATADRVVAVGKAVARLEVEFRLDLQGTDANFKNEIADLIESENVTTEPSEK